MVAISACKSLNVANLQWEDTDAAVLVFQLRCFHLLILGGAEVVLHLLQYSQLIHQTEPADHSAKFSLLKVIWTFPGWQSEGWHQLTIRSSVPSLFSVKTKMRDFQATSEHRYDLPENSSSFTRGWHILCLGWRESLIWIMFSMHFSFFWTFFISLSEI